MSFGSPSHKAFTSPSRVRSMKMMARSMSKRLSDIDNDIEQPVRPKAYNTRPHVIGEDGLPVNAPAPEDAGLRAARRARMGTLLWLAVGLLLLVLAAEELHDYDNRALATRVEMRRPSQVLFPAVALCMPVNDVTQWAAGDCTTDPDVGSSVERCVMTPLEYTDSRGVNMTCRVFNADGHFHATAAGQLAVLSPVVELTDHDQLDNRALSMAFYHHNADVHNTEMTFVAYETKQMVRMIASEYIDIDGNPSWRYNPSVTALPLDQQETFGFDCSTDNLCAMEIDLGFSSLDVLATVEHSTVSVFVMVGALGGFLAFLKAIRTLAMTSYMVLSKNDLSEEQRQEYINERATDSAAHCSTRCGVFVRAICNGL